MGKLKVFFNKKTSNKVAWIALVVVILVIVISVSATSMASYLKKKSELASAEAEKETQNVLNQENLADTSKMSEEELKKLNEKELEEKKKKDKNTTTTTKNKYYIKVNYGAQVVTIYTYDKNGKYTVPVRACICSTGDATPTSGVYRLSWKATWGKLFGNVWGHYCYQIVGDILFHSVPYMQNRNDTLVSAYYDRLGRKDSMGCIRLTTIDAKWIFDNCAPGTQVEFYSSSNPGPLGKPTAKKISNAPGKLKNWDPTDPDPKNPWRDYKEEEKKPDKDEDKNETVNNEVLNSEVGNNEVGNNETANTETGNNEENSEGDNSEINNEVDNSQEDTESGSTENNEIENTEQNIEDNTETNTQKPTNEESTSDTEQNNSQVVTNNEINGL